MKSPAQGRAFREDIKALILLRFLAAQIHNSWSGDEDGTVCSDHHTNHQCEDESLDVVATKQEDGQQHHKCGQRGVDRTAQSAVQSQIKDLFAVLFLAVQGEILTDSVKDDHRVVDRVTNDREDGSDEGLVDFHCEGQNAPENAEE